MNAISVGYMGAFQATREPLPQIDISDLGNRVDAQFDAPNPELQFRGILRRECELDQILRAGTDVPGREYTWLISPNGSSRLAISHAYVELLLANRADLVIVVLAYRAECLTSTPTPDKFSFKTAPIEAFVGLRYLKVNF
ncbi:hypothetical protein HYU18_02485 [Candidatus Woesearchaeota archaeon]|nr:hypothetical protein [Candidatus Woesearchaeota archaeon]